MKNIILIICLGLLFSSCVEKQIILESQTPKYPIFPISEFTKYKEIDITANIKVSEIGVKYIVLEESEFIRLVDYTKALRIEHNLLIDYIEKFNKEIENLSKN